jgi:hypothetical protein
MHLVDIAHLVDRHALARLNTAVILTLIGSGLTACALGALVYDVGRLFAIW